MYKKSPWEIFLLSQKRNMEIKEFTYPDIIPGKAKDPKGAGNSLLTLAIDTIKDIFSQGKKVLGKTTKQWF